MTIDQALDLSLERLLATAAARRRLRAAQTLKLAQAIVAGMGDNDAWQRIQHDLIDEAS